MFVQQVNLPVNEGTQEVAFTELDNAFRVVGTGKIMAVQCFHNGFLPGLVIQPV
ncbi:hypothetical protein ACNKHQ_09150 [Shigella flexneri]